MASEVNWGRLIWQNESAWPKAGRDYVFLARAFHEVGRALYGSEWLGDEFAQVTKAAEQKRKLEDARRVAALSPPPQSLASYPSRESWSPRPAPAKVEEGFWAKVLTNVEAEVAANSARIARRDGVAGWIAERARDDELQSFAMRLGGPMMPIAPHTWNQAIDWQHFQECRARVALRNGGSAEGYIFLASSTLAAHIDGIGHRGDVKVSDERFVEMMRELIVAKKARSPTAAAKMLAGRLGGTGNEESNIRRVQRRYRKLYP